MTDNSTTPIKQAPANNDVRLPTRSGTIVWGGILLLAAAIAAAATIVDATFYTPRFILWTIVGFGTLLVTAGVIGAVARVNSSSRARERDASALEDADAAEDTPFNKLFE